MPRKRDIEAAITAHNATDGPEQMLLPPEAARRSLWQGSVGDLVARGFDRRTVRLLLRALIEVGFLSMDQDGRDMSGTYHLHLPPQRRP